MKRWLGYTAGFVLIFSLSVLWHLPAAFVLKQVQLPDQLSLAQVQGPWWGGSGTLLWQRIPAGKLHWQLQGMSWLWGRPQVSVSWVRGQSTVQAHVRLSPGQVHLERLHGQLETASLRGLPVPMMETLLSFVQFHLEIAQLQGQWRWQQRWPFQLSGQGEIKNAVWMEAPLPLIDWQLQAGTQPEQYLLKGTGKAEWGSLQLEATLAPARYQVQLQAQAGKKPPVALTGFLRPSGSERWQGQWQGRW